MAEDSSLDSSFPVVHKGNGNLVLRTVEDGEKEQPDSSSSSSNLLDSKMLPTGRLEFSCCSKKGCQNVFNKTIGRIEMKSVEEIKLVFTSVLNAATVQSKILMSMQLKQKHRLVCLHNYNAQ